VINIRNIEEHRHKFDNTSTRWSRIWYISKPIIRCLDFQPDPSLQENTMKEELDIFDFVKFKLEK
jgi:hypothetical protein